MGGYCNLSGLQEVQNLTDLKQQIMIYRCVATFVLPDADFADDADERRSFIVLKENKSAFLCVICARLRPVNTSKHPVKSSFTSSQFLNFETTDIQIFFNI